ncbi:MAG: hypothetical protein IMF01_00090 [Proteobacteria bacterium]|nr:hypothetical protein [Pseudomonadota bacterium]
MTAYCRIEANSHGLQLTAVCRTETKSPCLKTSAIEKSIVFSGRQILTAMSRQRSYARQNYVSHLNKKAGQMTGLFIEEIPGNPGQIAISLTS